MADPACRIGVIRHLSLALLLLLPVFGCAANPRPFVTPFAPEDLRSGWTVIGTAQYRCTAQRVVLDQGSITSVDIAILTGNRYAPQARLTLTVEAPAGHVAAQSTQLLRTGTEGWVRFPVNLAAAPGTEVVLRLAEDAGEVFGWRYRVSPTRQGRALLLGRDDGQYDFLYKINP